MNRRPKTRLLVGLLLMLSLSLLLACTDDNDGARAVPEEQGAAAPKDPLPPSAESSLVSPSAPEPTAVPPTATAPPTPTPPPLAARVNGEYVLLEDYERRVALYEAALLDQGLDPDSSEGQAELLQMRLDVLESLIDYSLISQGAEELGIVVSEPEIEAQMEDDAVAGGGWEAFDEWLAETGLTREDYENMLRESLLAQHVLELLAADIPETTEQVYLRLIVVDSQAAAEEVEALLQEGEDFGALAQEWSLDPMTAEEGGDLGWLPRGVLEPEVERVAFSLPIGEVSDAVYLGGEYQILEVVDREADRELAPETRVDLELAAFDQWLEGLRRAAEIEQFVTE